ncbi:response regulator [Ideonella livida]|uniref:Response regulator n=1 Tax=Ideonella livida TaxID=2707176 RepID=A0A7C9PHX9_9BURK|nr:response regulator [Ideonella livida]NDY92433.1 response regulator [Ideonella livida]
MRLPEDLSRHTALVVEYNPTTRSILCGQLRELGYGQVLQSGRASEARKTLEYRQVDLVLCEMDFPGETRGGQHLLDELRREQLLPWSTVFIMVTGERRYHQVAEAAEAALDSYLIKPFTAQALADRITQARRRKVELKEIFTAMEAGDYETAARHCLERFLERRRYWLYAARLGAELFLRIGQLDKARLMFDAVVATQALPWARLGIARVQLEQQQTAAAMGTLESLVSDDPGYADAYDVLGRAQLSLGQLEEALATWQRAVSLTPGAVRRQQTLGMLALALGQTEVAGKALERAVILGHGSKLFDPQTLVSLALLRTRERDSKAVNRCASDLQRLRERDPDDLRLRRMAQVVQALELMLARQPAKLVEVLRHLAAEILRPDFDVEIAWNLTSLLALLVSAEVQLPAADEWVLQVGLRYCGNRAVTELLAQAAAQHPRHAEVLRHCHSQVVAAAEKAMGLSVRGRKPQALQALLRQGSGTLNAKFSDAAAGLLTAYGQNMPEAPALQAELDALLARMGRRSQSLPEFGQQGGTGGGLRLRTAGG